MYLDSPHFMLRSRTGMNARKVCHYGRRGMRTMIAERFTKILKGLSNDWIKLVAAK